MTSSSSKTGASSSSTKSSHQRQGVDGVRGQLKVGRVSKRKGWFKENDLPDNLHKLTSKTIWIFVEWLVSKSKATYEPNLARVLVITIDATVQENFLSRGAILESMRS